MICIILDILFYILGFAFLASVVIQTGIMGWLAFDITKATIRETRHAAHS